MRVLRPNTIWRFIEDEMATGIERLPSSVEADPSFCGEHVLEHTAEHDDVETFLAGIEAPERRVNLSDLDTIRASIFDDAQPRNLERGIVHVESHDSPRMMRKRDRRGSGATTDLQDVLADEWNSPLQPGDESLEGRRDASAHVIIPPRGKTGMFLEAPEVLAQSILEVLRVEIIRSVPDQ